MVPICKECSILFLRCFVDRANKLVVGITAFVSAHEENAESDDIIWRFHSWRDFGPRAEALFCEQPALSCHFRPPSALSSFQIRGACSFPRVLEQTSSQSWAVWIQLQGNFPIKWRWKIKIQILERNWIF